jgi:uncharacterized protein YegP (UPF0339 family)
MPHARYQVYRDLNNYYRFRLCPNSDGDAILESTEGYLSKHDCLQAIEMCRRVASYPNNYVKRQNGTQFYFLLQASKYEDLGKSQVFSSSKESDEGINLVKRDGITTFVEDQTMDFHK